MKSKVAEGDRVRVTDQVKRKEAIGHVIGLETHEFYNPATKRSSRRTWVTVLLENGTRQTYTPAQVKKLRSRKP